MAQSQDRPYCFGDSAIKEIAYQIKSRDILLLDTVLYREKIKILENQNTVKDSLIKNTNAIVSIKNYYIGTLESDVQSISRHNDYLVMENSKMKLKLKLCNYAIPISVGGGLILGYLITK